MTKMAIKAALSVVTAVFAAAGTAAPGAMAAKLPSDRSMKVVANYAWAYMPGKYTLPSGVVIITDKNNRKAVMVPDDILKQVIQRGVFSGRAQKCELFDEQNQNLAALRRTLRKKYKLTQQQRLYLHFLHLTTVQFMTGKFEIVGTDEKDRKLILKDRSPPKEQVPVKCTEAQKQSIRANIARYLASAPPPRAASTQPVVSPGK